MAIAIGDNFSYNGGKFLDGRDCFETLSDMKNFPEVSVPDGFKTYCKEDGREYRITKTNDLDPITGRWRVAEVEGIFGIKEVLNNDELDTINEDQIIFCDAGNSKKLYAYLPEYTREYVNINHTYTIEAMLKS